MAMQALRDGASSGVLKIFLMGILVLAVGGLVLTDVGGFFRGGVSSTDIAKVGDVTIDSVGFDQRARQALSRAGLSPQQAYEMGFMEEILRGDLQAAVLSLSASDRGLSIGEDIIKERLHDMIAPLVREGQTAQDTLDQVLRNQGMSEGQFITALSQEIRNGLLTGALQAGFATPPSYMTTELIRFDNEVRVIDYVSFTDAELAVTTAPDEEALRGFYEEEKEQFATPERRDIRLISIVDEAMSEAIDITDDELRQAYNENAAAYRMPERRVIAQAIVDDEETAREIFDVVPEVGNLRNAVTHVTGTFDAFVAPSAFQQDGLVENVGAAIFDTTTQKGQVLEPVQSPLGWHVTQLIDIEAPRTKPFEEVSEEIKEDLLQERILDEKYRIAGEIDDALAGGASAEELQAITTTEVIEVFGLTQDNPQIPESYAAQSDVILEEAFILLAGEGSPVQEMDDGTLYVVFVDSVTPKAYQDFGAVRGALSDLWLTRRQAAEAQAKILAYLTILESGEQDLASFAQEQNKTVESLSGLTRQDPPPQPFIPMSVFEVFEAELQGYVLMQMSDGFALAQVTNAILPEVDSATPQNQIRQAEINDALIPAISNEAIGHYLDTRREDYGVSVNRTLLEQMYGPEQDAF